MTLALAEPRTAPASFYCVRGSNDTYWRVDLPAKAVGAKVCKIDYATGREQLERPGLRGRQFRWVLTDDGADYPDHEGAAVFTRPDKPRATHALAMKANGARIVAEVDDNYLSDRKLSLPMRHVHDKDDRRRHLEAMGCFDHIVVTTRWLRDRYAWALRKELNVRPEFHVCGNHVDLDDLVTPFPRTDRLRVGFMASPSHVWDVTLAYPALKWAHDAGHEVVIVGYDPNWWPQTRLEHRDGRLVAHHMHDNPLGFAYTHIPWVDPREYERAAVPLDVALAPLRRDDHTLGKSDVKWIEYSLSGAATIASAGTVYTELVHGETGFLAGGREEFLYWTRELCRNGRLRDEVAANALSYVLEHRTIQKRAGEWREAVTG